MAHGGAAWDRRHSGQLATADAFMELDSSDASPIGTRQTASHCNHIWHRLTRRAMNCTPKQWEQFSNLSDLAKLLINICRRGMGIHLLKSTASAILLLDW